MKPTQLLELIIRALPYPSQIRELEIEENAVRFVWRSQRFRVSTSMRAETVGNGVLIGDDASILLSSLIEREFIGQNVQAHTPAPKDSQ
jgi:hypothetical protein